MAQKLLLLERQNKDEPSKYYVGQEMTYQLKSDKIWRTSTILDLSYEQQMIFFANGNVHVDDVRALRFFNIRRIGNGASLSLATFAGGWGLFALGDEIAGGDNDWRLNAHVIGTSAALAGIVWLATRQRTKKMNDRRRLRITDLTLKAD